MATSHRPALLLSVLAISSGCGSTAEPEAPAVVTTSTPVAVESVTPLSPAEIVAHVDAREAGPLLAAVRTGAVEGRRSALWALARVHDDEAATGLVVGLRDTDAEARRAAVFGVGALEREAPSAAVEALLGALAVEPVAPPPSHDGLPQLAPTTRAMMLWSLARTTDVRAVPALERGLSEDTESRVAVCRGLAYGAPAGWPESLVRAALERATSDASPRVRESCWQGLGRVTVPPSLAEAARAGAASAVSSSSTEPDEVEIRVQAARLLGRLPASDGSREALRQASLDPEWRVAVPAIRSLGTLALGHEATLGEALEAALARWWPAPPTGVGEAGPAAGGPTHVVLTVLEVAQPYSRAAPIHDRATAWLARVERIPSSRDQAWIECRAAELVDLGRGWPSRVERCGVDVVDDDTRRALAAEVLGLQDAAEAQRVTYLERIFREGGPRAREAVLVAAARLPLDLALPFARLGLAVDDEGVTLGALELVRTLAPLARQRRDDAALAASLAGQATAPSRFLVELDAPVLAAARRLLAGHSLEGRVTLSGTAAVLADPGAAPDQHELIELLGPLATHPSHGVRTEARLALTALGVAEVASSVDAVPETLTPTDSPARRATLRTERGDIVIELASDVTPTTVARFEELARAGDFDGLTFHRVVAGFVAQGGDPRGDGYGGPDWWQRCEDSPLAYERGTVGMALAGRDTGGSQFFITLGPQHHLDGRYTVFGRVIEGLEHVDGLQVGDPIVGVTVE